MFVCLCIMFMCIALFSFTFVSLYFHKHMVSVNSKLCMQYCFKTNKQTKEQKQLKCRNTFYQEPTIITLYWDTGVQFSLIFLTSVLNLFRIIFSPLATWKQEPIFPPYLYSREMLSLGADYDITPHPQLFSTASCRLFFQLSSIPLCQLPTHRSIHAPKATFV